MLFMIPEYYTKLYEILYKKSHLDELIEDDRIEAGQVLHVVPLHDRAVLPHMGSQLLHVEDQFSNVPKMINKLHDIRNY